MKKLIANEYASIIKSKDTNQIDMKINKMKTNDINRRDSLGNTLLFYALKENDKVLINKLLKKGADINIKNKKGTIPLYLAIKYSERAIINTMIDSGGDIFCKYKENSLLHYAMKRMTKDEQKEKNAKKDSIAMVLMRKGLINLNPSTMNELIRCDEIEENKI